MPSCWRSCRLLDGRQDVRIGGAAADIAAHPFADLRIGQGWLGFRQILGDIAWRAYATLAEHPHGGTDLPRRAITALKTIVLNKSRLQRMEPIAVGEPLDRGDRLAVMHCSKRQAGVDATTVQQHRACAALAVIAALLGSCQREMLTH